MATRSVHCANSSKPKVTTTLRSWKITLVTGGNPRARRGGSGVPPTTSLVGQSSNLLALNHLIACIVCLKEQKSVSYVPSVKYNLCLRLHLSHALAPNISPVRWIPLSENKRVPLSEHRRLPVRTASTRCSWLFDGINLASQMAMIPLL